MSTGFNYNISYGGGVGPDIWDKEIQLSAVDIRDAIIQAAHRIKDSDGWIFMVSQEDYPMTTREKMEAELATLREQLSRTTAEMNEQCRLKQNCIGELERLREQLAKAEERVARHTMNAINRICGVCGGSQNDEGKCPDCLAAVSNATIADLTARLDSAKKLQRLTESNEIDWMRKHDDLTARLAKAESALATVRELRDFETKQIVELRSENDSMRYILTQYQLGNAHAAKDELVAAATHYDEAERLFSTLNQKAGEPPCATISTDASLSDQ